MPPKAKYIYIRTVIALSIITLLGAMLRFYHLSGTSLSNDELSALSRLRFHNFHDLMMKGVAVDGHPAGVQVFLYFYTQVFGFTDFIIRLPFAVLGVLTVPVCFFWSRKWFGEMAALFTAASVAVLQFPIYYSQLARPYSPGLFFSMLMLWAWTEAFFYKRKNYFWQAVYILSTALCAYTHYFSLLFAAVLWFTGLFFIPKIKYKTYAIAGFLAVLLFIPHIYIFLAQLRLGGLMWLGKPTIHFLPDFIFYSFNDSWLVLGFALAVFIFSAIYASGRKHFKYNPFRLLALLLLLSVFLIGFVKSYYGKPVLQYPVLLFVFPLLPAFLFSYVDGWVFTRKLKYTLLFLWIVLCFCSLTIEKKYYRSEHYGQFKPLANAIVKWNKTYGAKNITYALNIYNSYYLHHYLTDLHDTTNIKSYRCNNQILLDSLFNLVKKSETKYFGYGWSNIGNFPQAAQIIQLKYGRILEDNEHFDSGIMLFERTKPTVSPVLKLNDTTGKNLIQLPYIPALENALVRIEAEIDLSALDPEIDVVASIENADKMTFWATSRVSDYFAENQKKAKIVWFIQLPKKTTQTENLNLYIWNRSTAKMQVSHFAVQLFKP